MRRAERKQWAATRSLDDLGAMTVKWLHGEVQETPGHWGPPASETEDITDYLVWLNRHGFVTTNSQPALPAGDDGPAQAAWVSGYTSPSRASAIEQACDEAGLVTDVDAVSSFRPWWRRGDAPLRNQLDDMVGIGADAWDDLEESVFVDVHDPEAGRSDLLWETLMGALGAADRAGA